jgi:acyl carrier protein
LKNSKEKIFAELKKIIQELFEIDPQQIKLDTKLYQDLDLDSIDAIDLIVHLQSITKKKFEPEEFKSVITIADIVDIIYLELSKNK